MWIKPSDIISEYTASKFGQFFIARQLHSRRAVVNWNNQARDLKTYMYNNQLDLTQFQTYKNIAEQQLWIFNNEPIVVTKKEKLVSPGSGLSWMLNIIHPATQEMQIVDISRVQIQFCQALWNTWNGEDYGNFVWKFVKQNQLIHYELDNPNLTPIERLQLRGQSRLIKYVNDKFNQLVSLNFQSQWQLARQTKRINFCNDDLIQWVLNNNIDDYNDIWCSNILDYKWTLLHTTVEQYKNFQLKIT